VSWYATCGFVDVAEPVEAFFWNWNASLFWVNGGIGKVGSLSKVFLGYIRIV
jgi:hypothetical protein